MFKKLLFATSVITALAFGQAYSQQKHKPLDSDPDSIKVYLEEIVTTGEDVEKLDAKSFRLASLKESLHAGKSVASFTDPKVQKACNNLFSTFNYRGLPSKYVSASLGDENGTVELYGDIFTQRGLGTIFDGIMYKPISFGDVSSASQSGPLGVIRADYKDFKDKKFGAIASIGVTTQYVQGNYPVAEDLAFALYIDNNYLLVPIKNRDILPIANTYQLSGQSRNLLIPGLLDINFQHCNQTHHVSVFHDNMDVVLTQSAQHDIFTIRQKADIGEESSLNILGLIENMSETVSNANTSAELGTTHYGLNAFYMDKEKTNITNTFGIKVDVLSNKSIENIGLTPGIIDNVFYSQLGGQGLSPALEDIALREYAKLSDNDKMNRRPEFFDALEKKYYNETGLDLINNKDYIRMKNEILHPSILDPKNKGEFPTFATAYVKRHMVYPDGVDNMFDFEPTIGVSMLRRSFALPYGASLSYLTKNSETRISYMYSPTTLKRNDLENIFNSAASIITAHNYSASYTHYVGDMKVSAAAYFKEFDDDGYCKSRGLELMIGNDEKNRFVYTLSGTVLETVTDDHPMVGSIPGMVNLMTSYNIGPFMLSSSITFQKGYYTDRTSKGVVELDDNKTVDVGITYFFDFIKPRALAVSITGYNIPPFGKNNVLYQEGSSQFIQPFLLFCTATYTY